MNKESEIHGVLAVIQSDLKKIVKHFKLDRRSKNNPEDPTDGENGETEDSGKLLREILERIGEIGKSQTVKILPPNRPRP